MPGLHNVIFGSGGAALAQIHLSIKQEPGKKQLASAGFEPAPPKRSVQDDVYYYRVIMYIL